MKKLPLYIIFILLSTLVNGQSFTLSELIKINDYQIDDFDTYVTQKGYKYYENKNTDFAESTVYAFNKEGVRVSYISIHFYKRQSKKMVSFQTGDNTTYLKIKSDLKILGFKFVNSDSYEGATFFNYEKGNLELTLVSSVQETTYGDKLTNYEISVIKIY